MRKLILLIIGLSFYSCVVKDPAEESTMWSTVQYKIEEVEIDKCEYIIILGKGGRSIIHKANCKNQFHEQRTN